MQHLIENDLETQRVLVVDDSDLHRQLAVQLLERQGCEVDVARNGAEAIDAFRQHAYALILMDCRMPSLDGFSAAKTIRHLEHHRSAASPVPIVALTADITKLLEDRCQRVGMNDCLAKPLCLDTLRQMLQRYTNPTHRA